MNSDLTKSPLFKTRSSRHHYIPQFLVEGFTSSDGMIYVYDKTVNRIHKNPRPPKSVFFEKDRNTIPLKNNLESSILEDYLYSMIDNEGSRVVRLYQKQALNEITFDVEDTAHLLFFLINLFWRIPLTDYAAQDLMERSEIVSPGIDPEILRNDSAYKKIMRAGLFKHHVEEMRSFGKSGKFLINIHSNEYPIFVIGDYPILFRKIPTEFRSFGETDFIFPLNSGRIYTSTQKPFKLTRPVSLLINAAIIDQSRRYVGCWSKEILESSIKLLDDLKGKGMNYGLPAYLFEQPE